MIWRGGGGGVYSDLEICMISSLLHLNQLWGGGGAGGGMSPLLSPLNTPMVNE